MRAPKRRSPLKRQFVGVLPENTEAIAGAATYIGSPEHKNTGSFAGQRHPRRDASLCDIRFSTQQAMLTAWLIAGIRKGCCSTFGDGEFPKYVWYKDVETVYEARLVNKSTGEYKGYPLSREEWPNGVENYYG